MQDCGKNQSLLVPKTPTNVLIIVPIYSDRKECGNMVERQEKGTAQLTRRSIRKFLRDISDVDPSAGILRLSIIRIIQSRHRSLSVSGA